MGPRANFVRHKKTKPAKAGFAFVFFRVRSHPFDRFFAVGFFPVSRL